MEKIRVRTQTGHRLYLPPLEMYVPGEETEIEVDEKQLAHLKLDGRVMINEQIDDFYKELKLIGARKARGNDRHDKPPREIPTAKPVNAPGGERLPDVEAPSDAKSHADLIKAEKASQKKPAAKSKGKGKGKK